MTEDESQAGPVPAPDGNELRAWGRWIRLLRVGHDMTQQDLAELAGLDKNVIGHIERGERNVGVLTVFRLARALGVRTQDLFPEETGPLVPPRP